MTPGKMEKERCGREEREQPTCMYLVKWKDRGYKNVERSEQRFKRNITQNSAGVR